jgi:hypothetical protein
MASFVSELQQLEDDPSLIQFETELTTSSAELQVELGDSSDLRRGRLGRRVAGKGGKEGGGGRGEAREN